MSGDFSPEVKKAYVFMNEWLAATGRNGDYVLADGGLPDVVGGYPVVRIPREDFVRFRNNYMLLLQDVAYLLHVPVEELTPMHLFAAIVARYKQDEEEAKSE